MRPDSVLLGLTAVVFFLGYYFNIYFLLGVAGGMFALFIEMKSKK